ncbi:hypothetical protein BV22DRAFT_36274 [Leucogyrophana mollusca]|uniref:Uncharacterized protein n=1 Tax=Leucogyrophana mollusca TaxID=85980 RepID=A0ACB8BYR9_9AGAM|nr:hypothetical protein BV22DRAFT_36274 [Leucogyrophana mollusca]
MNRPNTPPPVHHVLRPHHVDLIAIFLLVFKEFEKNLPPQFMLHIYRFLLHETSEVTEPRSHEEILQALQSMPQSDTQTVQSLIIALKTVPSQLTTADQMTNFFHSM